jgi:hypothetical protein
VLPSSIETLGVRLCAAARTTASTWAGERAIEIEFVSPSGMPRTFAYYDNCLQAMFFSRSHSRKLLARAIIAV